MICSVHREGALVTDSFTHAIQAHAIVQKAKGRMRQVDRHPHKITRGLNCNQKALYKLPYGQVQEEVAIA